MSEDIARCQLCGEPMPPGEEMFNYHGYSGPCPKPPLPENAPPPIDYKAHAEALAEALEDAILQTLRHFGPGDVEDKARAALKAYRKGGGA